VQRFEIVIKPSLNGERTTMATSMEEKNEIHADRQRIRVTRNGPYLVFGYIPLTALVIETDKMGDPIQLRSDKRYPQMEKYSLCRCGQSKNRPFCDGTHVKIGFDGTETASKESYIKKAKKFKGQGILLTDSEGLCARVRFCHRAGGIWNLVRKSGDSKARATAIEEVAFCASGRLVIWDEKTGKPIEPRFEPLIALIEGPKRGAMGPIWVRGGVPVESAEGEAYEIRNRVTLCCCGKSTNKPFCDGRHYFECIGDEAIVESELGKLRRDS
jgi:CDGSH-type Zn-finger protein